MWRGVRAVEWRERDLDDWLARRVPVAPGLNDQTPAMAIG
ncbi:hypothetical protein [Paraburkholderia sp. J10-1]